MRPASLALVVVLAACQGKSAADLPPDYRADIANLCDAEARSGALEAEPGQRSVIVAAWLGPIIKTDAARAFLGDLRRLDPPAKATALRQEAARAGLKDCPLAAVWGQASSANPAESKGE